MYDAMLSVTCCLQETQPLNSKGEAIIANTYTTHLVSICIKTICIKWTTNNTM